MDIAGLSMNLSMMKAANSVQVSLLKKTMDTAEENAGQMIRLMHENARAMELSVNPEVGANIDLRG